MTTTVSSLVRPNGTLTDHPLCGMFRQFVRSRKPGLFARIRDAWRGNAKTMRALACEWLNEGEGLVYALQHDLNVARGVPQFIERAPASDLVDFDDLVRHWEGQNYPEGEDNSHAA